MSKSPSPARARAPEAVSDPASSIPAGAAYRAEQHPASGLFVSPPPAGLEVSPPIEDGPRQYQRNPTVVEVPAVCPKCGGAKREITHTREFPGRPLLVDGHRYTGQRIRRARCLTPGCACRFIIRSPLAENTPRPKGA